MLYFCFGFLLSMWNDDRSFEILFEDTISIAQTEYSCTMFEIRLKKKRRNERLNERRKERTRELDEKNDRFDRGRSSAPKTSSLSGLSSN